MSLVVKDLVKTFGKGDAATKVLKGINFEVQPGEFCYFKWDVRFW